MRARYAAPIRGSTRIRSLLDGLLAPANGVEVLQIGEGKVEFDHRELATRNMAYLAYEADELSWLRRLLRPGETRYWTSALMSVTWRRTSPTSSVLKAVSTPSSPLHEHSPSSIGWRKKSCTPRNPAYACCRVKSLWKRCVFRN